MEPAGRPAIAIVIPSTLSTHAKARVADVITALIEQGENVTVFTPDEALAARLGPLAPTRRLRPPTLGVWRLAELARGKFDVGHVVASTDSLAKAATHVLEKSGARVLFDTAYLDLDSDLAGHERAHGSPFSE